MGAWGFYRVFGTINPSNAFNNGHKKLLACVRSSQIIAKPFLPLNAAFERPLVVFCCLSDQVETFDQMCQIRYELLHLKSILNHETCDNNR